MEDLKALTECAECPGFFANQRFSEWWVLVSVRKRIHHSSKWTRIYGKRETKLGVLQPEAGGGDGMKAYKAWVDYGEGSTIVFAETRNQAKVIALSCDCCEDAKYTDIRVHRMKELDRLYKGKSEMDWYDDETRLLLVRDFGWACVETSWECDGCKCRKYCSWHGEEGAD